MILGFYGGSVQKVSHDNEVLRLEFGQILIARGRAHDGRHCPVVMHGRGQPRAIAGAQCKRTVCALGAEMATKGLRTQLPKPRQCRFFAELTGVATSAVCIFSTVDTRRLAFKVRCWINGFTFDLKAG
jgi:hypothetical protein